MKILQMIYTLSSGGAERLVVDLCNEFVRQGHAVDLCVVRDLDEGRNDFYRMDLDSRVRIHDLKIKGKLSLAFFTKIHKVLKLTKPDVVHAHLNVVNYLFFWALLLNKRCSFFHTIHTDAKREIKYKIEWLLRHLFYKMKWIVPVSISPATSLSFKVFYGIDASAEIENGRACISKASDDTESSLFGSLNGMNIFVHVGRCAPVKNQRMLIEVFNRLIAARNDIALLILGGGFDSPLGTQLKTLAGPGIYFVGEKNNVGLFYRKSCAFCLTSVHEGMPITLIEALSEGCLPICTRAGGVVDMFENGVTGILADEMTMESYYGAVVHYLNNKDNFSRDKMQALYRKRYSIERCASVYLDLYAKCLNSELL